MFDPRASQLEQAALGKPKVNQTANHFVMGTRHEKFDSTILDYAA